MTSAEKKKFHALMNAYNVFVDANLFDEEHLICYFLVVENIFDVEKILQARKPVIFLQSLANALMCLPEREQKVIKLRNGFYGNMCTLEEVGKSLGVSREMVRQIEVRAYNILRSSKYKRTMSVQGRAELIDDRIKELEQRICELKLQRTLFDNDNAHKDIRAIGLSERCKNALYNHGIKYVWQLATFERKDFEKVRNIGNMSVDEILAKRKELIGI